MGTLGTFVRDQAVTAAELNAIGTWTSYTPEWTNLNVGNGSSAGRYCRLNDLVFMQVELLWGSTTDITDNVWVSFPLPCARFRPDGSNGQIFFEDADGSDYHGVTRRVSGRSLQVLAWDTSGTYLRGVSITNSIPFTWVSGDRLLISHWYQPA